MAEAGKKLPVTRKKPGNRGKKAPAKEVDDRVAFVAQLITRRIHKHQIKQALATKYGLGWRQAENYITRARAYILERSNKPRDEHVAEAVSFYEGIIRSPESSTHEQMRAQDSLVHLLGLAAPVKIASTTPDGEASAPMVVEVVIETREDVQKFLTFDQFQKRMAGGGSATGGSTNVVDGVVLPQPIEGCPVSDESPSAAAPVHDETEVPGTLSDGEYVID